MVTLRSTSASVEKKLKTRTEDYENTRLRRMNSEAGIGHREKHLLPLMLVMPSKQAWQEERSNGWPLLAASAAHENC